MTQLLGWRGVDPATVRAAAWVARCVGRGQAAPLRPQDLAALATYLRPRELAPGEVAFAAGRPAAGGVDRPRRPAGAGGRRGAAPRGRGPAATGRRGRRHPPAAGDGAALHRLRRPAGRVPVPGGRRVGAAAARAPRDRAALAVERGGAAGGQPGPTAGPAGPLADRAGRPAADGGGQRPGGAAAAADPGRDAWRAAPLPDKVLKQFQRRGLLVVGYRTIRILDGAALQRLAGGRP
jgi:hypothetical protein